MNKAVNKKDVEAIVLNSFLRVIKDNKKYCSYVRGLHSTPLIRAIVGRNKIVATPFSGEDATANVISKLKEITKQHANGVTLDSDQYEYVTMVVNHLLHFFLERSYSLPILTRIGEDVYDISCLRLFGDEVENEDVFLRPREVEIKREDLPDWEEGKDRGYMLGNGPADHYKMEAIGPF